MSTESSSIRIAGIVNDSITDGPGIRLTIFTQGCPHRCEGCHNQHTWSMEGGKEITVEELRQKVVKNPLLCGVTLSGGEPMLWAKQFLPFAQFLKERNIDLAIYSGYTFEQLLGDSNSRKLLACAHVLIDGKFEKDKKSLLLKFKGSSNQRVIDLPESLQQGKVVLEKSESWN